MATPFPEQYLSRRWCTWRARLNHRRGAALCELRVEIGIDKAATGVRRCYRFLAAEIRVKASRFPAHARRIQRRRTHAARSGMFRIGVLVGLMVIGVVFAMT